MIERKDLLSLEYYKHRPFTGSFKGMRYRIEKTEENEEVRFLATVFPGPFSSDNTPEEKKEKRLFPFTEEGLSAVTAWLNESWETDPARWDSAL